MEERFLNLTEENLDREHLCCIIRSQKPHPGVEAKRAWLAQRLEIENQELTVHYSPQCPYIHQSVALVRKACGELKMPYTLISVDTLETAKALPCVFNNWAVFYQGKFVTVNLLDAAALKRLLKQ